MTKDRPEHHWRCTPYAGRLALWSTVLFLLFAHLQANGSSTIFNIADGDVASLIAALEAAEDGDEIHLAENGIYTLTEPNNITSGTNGLPVIAREITIDGHGATIQREDGGPHFRIFYLQNVGPEMTFTNLTVKNGSTLSPGGGLGGGMYNFNSHPTITNCTFLLNRADESGGGMVNVFNSSPTITDCRFEANFAGDRGGGMANLSNTHPTVTNSVFKSNVVTGEGGGMYNLQNQPVVQGCTFVDNVALTGGGMSNNNSQPTVTNSTFSGNWADYGAGMSNANESAPSLSECVFQTNSGWWGGGMLNDGSSPTLIDCQFLDNEVRDNDIGDGGGGGIANKNTSEPLLTNCLFLENEARAGLGGGIYNENSSPTITACLFKKNLAEPAGGGIYNEASSPAITDSLFETNSSTNRGGGIANVNNSAPTITNTIFRSNSTIDLGGALYSSQSLPSVTGCTFQENVADSGGAIANVDSSTATVEDCLFTDNKSFIGNGAGIANLNGSQSTVTDSAFKRNAAALGGGIFSDGTSSSDVGSTSFCENSPDPIAGPWNDLGANQFNDVCGGPSEGTYENWVEDQFDEADWENEIIAGPLANPAGDGIPNLLKYALGLNPAQAYPGALPLPTIQAIPTEGDEKFLTLAFSHPSDLSDVAYDVRISSDLSDWSESALLILSEDDGIETTRTYRDPLPSPASERRFMRLKVTRQ